MAVEIELHVPCSRGARHPVRIRLTSWENWDVIDSTCIQTLGRERGANAPCYQILMARDLQIQLLALNALGMVGTSAAPILTGALKDQNVDVRRNACWVLGELRAGSAVEALKDTLDDYNASVRRTACWALGQIGDPAAVEALIECARDQDHRIRSAACAALGNIGDPAAVPALKAALADSNVNVRNAAQEALKNITNQRIVDITVECTNGQMHSVSVEVSNWGSWEVIDSTCMQTLGQASGRMALCYHRVMERSLEVRRSVVSALGRKGRSGVSALIGALADSEVRALACQMLGQINDKTAIPALRVHAEVMEEARYALAKLGGTSMALQEAVCTLAEQQHWGVLCRALTSDLVRDAIVQLGSRAVPALIDALRDDDPRIRQAACTALGQIRDKAPVPALIEQMEDTTLDVRITACTALGQIGDPSAVPALLQRLEDADWSVRSAACTALGQIGNPDAVFELIKRLQDSVSDVRSAACTALGQIRDPSAVPALIACLDDRFISEEVANALVQIGKPAVPVLIEALTSPSHHVRSAACTALGQIGDNTAVPELIKRLRDSVVDVRIAACTALGKIGDTEAVPELIQCLEDADLHVPTAACTVLGKIGDAAAIPALRVHAEIMEEARLALAKLGGTSMALQDAVCSLAAQCQWGVLCRALTSDQVRDAIVQLGRSAVPALIDALRDVDPKIRLAACTALGQIGDPAAVYELTKRLQDSVSDVRIAACTALGQIGDPSAVPALVACLDQQDVSEAAANALVQIGKPAVPALIEALTSPSNRVRIAACTALGQIGDPSAVPALIACLDQQDISEAAANALVQIGKPAVPALIETLTSPSNRVRIAACTALGQIGDAAAAPGLIQCLKDADRDVRIAACTVLGQIGDNAAVPALIIRLEDADLNVRRAACTALGQIGDPSAVPALIACLDQWDISQAATNALVQIGKPAVPALIEALKSENDFVRSAACIALGEIGDAAAVPVLIQCLKDTYSDVRCAACRALGKIGDTAVVPAFIEQLKDTNRDVRIAACTALGQIRDSSAVPALISLLCDKEVDVRIAATDAIVNIGEAAIPALQEAITSGDPTIHKKVSGILNIIKQRMQR